MTRPYVRTEQPLTLDQRLVLFALRRDVERFGAPVVKPVSEKATQINDRRRQARQAARGEV